MDQMEAAVEPEDIRDSLKDYVEKDLIEIDGEGVKITPKGSGRLARYVLRRIWENLAADHAGAHAAKEEGFGMSDGFACRKYEYGDEFFKIDMEKTLLAALEKGKGRAGRIEFDTEDLWVRETVIDTKVCVGLIVDESGSMSGDKIHAAMDISLALSELIKRNAGDKMRLFLFSNHVREMGCWDMLNVTFSGGTTDIRSALKRFRTAVAGERAEKQVYLITDTEPNCEDGKYIGFEKATLGVLQEALVYQREGITLNIIMLDSTPHLREFASVLARRNLGRVFFAEPKNLGKVVIEDYLRTRKRQNRKRASEPSLLVRDDLLFRKIRCSSPCEESSYVVFVLHKDENCHDRADEHKPGRGAERQKDDGYQGSAGQRPERDISPDEEGGKEDDKDNEHREGLHREKDAQGCRDAFAPLELEIEGEEVAREGGKAGGRDDACRQPAVNSQPRGDEPFQHVAKSVTMPRVFPAVLITFVAPMLPLPVFRGSCPFAFERRRPTGIEPSRYERIIQTTATTILSRPPDHAYRFLPLIVNRNMRRCRLRVVC